jgi:hypothetical protein
LNFAMKGIIILIFVLLLSGFLIIRQDRQFDIPKGETKPLTANNMSDINVDVRGDVSGDNAAAFRGKRSQKEILVTNNIRHSIPLEEILSGGVAKDDIPSIDKPKFVSAGQASFLNDDDVGLGLLIGDEARFYPYQILVHHEIVNDRFLDRAVAVTYCPLCATGVVFDAMLDAEPMEFGVSGKLWQSNLLMYNRSVDEKDESLWSQVLGEAVLGAHTGKKLAIISSDTVLFSNWKEAHPDTKVLSRDTGFSRSYGRDPYGNYYTSERIIFPTATRDPRLHPKTYVLGIEIDNHYKAYEADKLALGETIDEFAGQSIRITKDDIGVVRMSVSGKPIPYIGGFWFSWIAVHQDSELFGN